METESGPFGRVVGGGASHHKDKGWWGGGSIPTVRPYMAQARALATVLVTIPF